MFTASLIRAALVALALPLAGPAAAAAGDRDPDVQVRLDGEHIRADATMFVRASQQRVWAVVTDYERAPEFTPDLEESTVLARSGNTLRVKQKTRVRFGPFSIPIETVRDIKLTRPVRAESRLVEGSMKRYDATMELVPEPGGTRVVFRSVAVPDSALAGFATESLVKRETETHFRQLRAEIMRREHLASLKAGERARP